MDTPLLYRLTRSLVHLAVGVYFRKLEVACAEPIPQGPAIFAANHPQSVTDALVLGLATERMVHYLAHSGMFENRVRAWFLRQSGVIPVYRRADAGESVARNVDMFSECRRVMQRGGALGIFPEGVSADLPRLQKLKTGTARIALESEAANDWTLGVAIVPVGLHFESRRFRSRVLVRFGPQIQVLDQRAAYVEDPVETVHQVTSTLEDAIRGLVVELSHTEFEQFVRDVEEVYRSELLDRPELPIPGDSRLQREQWVSREIPRALDYFRKEDPRTIERLARSLRNHQRKLRRFRLQDAMLKEQDRSVRGEGLRWAVLGALGLPVAAYGVVWNYVPYKLTGWFADRLVREETKRHFAQLSVGTLLYLLYYPLLLLLAYRVLEPLATVLFAVSLPLSGFFARAYARWSVRRRRMLRLAFLELTNAWLLGKLRRQRQQLVAQLDAALAEYLRARSSST
ncbi:MAG: 1-acyl-sn-glycerol-3-phosphate acyltransferase [Candidatus Latescibacterota bacterium]|nr:MAG: 1-acyl-sn-glycerol-3-phosphate acyltransferase [Candidatus Latescibacterota bacterium]